MNKSTINDLIEGLKYIRDNGENIGINYESYINEICCTVTESYADAVMEIRIEYHDKKYIKDNRNIFNNWKSYEEYMKKRSGK